VLLSSVENTFRLPERAKITGIYKQVKIFPQSVTILTHLLSYYVFFSLSTDLVSMMLDSSSEIYLQQ